MLQGDTPTEGGSDVETILVIDDQDRVRAVVREMLQMKGYTVSTAEIHMVALDLTKKHAIHLLLADVVMPLMTGPEFARRVQALSPRTLRTAPSTSTASTPTVHSTERVARFHSQAALRLEQRQ